MNHAFLVRRRGEDSDFEGVETFPCIAVAEFGEMAFRPGVDLDVVLAEAAFCVGESAVDQFFEMFDLERFELKNLRAGDERTVDVEERIVSRGADEAEVSAFDVGQEDILLRLVEVVDLVHEENRSLPGSANAIGGSSDDAAHVGNVAFHAAEALEFCLRERGDDLRERGLASAGRAGKNDGGQAVGLDGSAQKFARCEDVLLADEFFERARSHAGGEG